jgi:outer membrane protein assembly factor BamB
MPASRTGLVLLTLALAAAPARGDDWPSWLGARRDGVWRETGILDKFPPGGPKVLWQLPLGAGYSGPAVADGKVYVMDRQTPVERPRDDRSAPKTGLPGRERVLCLDAATGQQVWAHDYDCTYAKVGYPAGPRTTPVVDRGRAFTLGTMGDLVCLDAATGKPVWSKNLAREYKAEVPVWGYAATPLIDGDRLVTLAGGPGSAVVALDVATGQEVWRALTAEEVGYSPPVMIEAGGRRQLAVFLDASLNGLDPETGRPFWKLDYPADAKPQRPAVSIAMPRQLGEWLYVSSFYHGPLMAKLAADRPDAAVAWRGKSRNPERPDGLHTIMATPLLADGHIYGVGGLGELVCSEVATNRTVWQTQQLFGAKKEFCGTAFLVPQGDRVFLFTDQGDLIIARLSPKGYEEIDRAHILDPSQNARGRTVVWSHPAFARRCLFARNDKEMVCVSLAAG